MCGVIILPAAPHRTGHGGQLPSGSGASEELPRIRFLLDVSQAACTANLMGLLSHGRFAQMLLEFIRRGSATTQDRWVPIGG